MNPRPDVRSPSPLFRLAALVLCPLYLFGLSALLSAMTARPVPLMLAAVTAWAICVTAVLGALAVRIYRHGSDALRFRLSTILLLTLLAAIYLAGYRWIYVALPPESRGPVTHHGVAAMSAVMLLFFLVTTALLIFFAEAVVALAVGCIRRRTPIRSVSHSGLQTALRRDTVARANTHVGEP
jgi:hypothetical protein